ncbi:MFS transporter [Streptomyces sp. NPDC050617]|uniref:MFS transporter n=1 Tax=Streptomyces sp. NPDC050617 TaxID=3154628 RepID=UPI0034458461
MIDAAPSTLPRSDQRGRTGMARAAGAATIGNALEWFDYATYSAFAAVFSRQIFGGEGHSALLNSFVVFGVGFFARPVGGALIGAYADRRGRRAALTLSIVLMAAGSLLIGVVPTYAAAGLWAPVLLTFARLTQGLSVGGDYGASPIFLSEIAAPGRRGLFSSLHYISLTCGLLAASTLGWLLSATLSTAALDSWGWRVPFLIGAAAALWGLYLRRSVQETEVFRAEQRRAAERRRTADTTADATAITTGGSGTGEITRTLWTVLRVIGMTALGSITFWTLTSYLPSHAQETDLHADSVFAASSCALLVFLVMQPLAGWLSDRVGRKPLLIGYSLGFAVLAYPLMSGIHIGSARTLFWVMLLGLTVFAGYSAISAAFLAEQFPTKVRSTGVGIAHNVSSALFGGTAPYLLARLDDAGHTGWFAGYVAVAALVACALFARIPETSGKPLQS